MCWRCIELAEYWASAWSLGRRRGPTNCPFRRTSFRQSPARAVRLPDMRPAGRPARTLFTATTRKYLLGTQIVRGRSSKTSKIAGNRRRSVAGWRAVGKCQALLVDALASHECCSNEWNASLVHRTTCLNATVLASCFTRVEPLQICFCLGDDATCVGSSTSMLSSFHSFVV